MESAVPTEPAPSRPEVETTTLNRGWLTKMVIIAAALLGLGLWGLYDALVAFPNRGAAHAEFTEWRYLEAANEAGRLLAADEPDPGAALARLNADRAGLRSRLAEQPEGSFAYRETSMDIAKLDWLTSLSRIGRVDAAHTTFQNPRDRLDSLKTAWEKRNQPKPLAAYDIPAQWVFVILGFGGFGWIMLIIARTRRRTFRYKPASSELTLPSGRAFTPADIAELDKRKWHKFYVTLRFKEGKGEPVTLDLLRHKPLEDWVLEMEKLTDGYEPPAERPDEPAPEREGSGVAMGGEHLSGDNPMKPSP